MLDLTTVRVFLTATLALNVPPRSRHALLERK